MTTSTVGALIYYTTEGSVPDTSSNLYSTGIHIWNLAGKPLNAYGVLSGLLDSNVATAFYSYPPLKTNQTTCWDWMGSPISCPSTGQDGEYQKGVSRSYTDNGDGTITDNSTGLVWQKCSIAQNNDSTCTGTASAFQWSSASSQCTGLNLAGRTWRLPTVEELQTLVDYGNNNPAIDSIFSNTPAAAFWTISEHAPSFNVFAWFVSFQHGDVSYHWKTNSFRIRCVSAPTKVYTSNFTNNGDGTIRDNNTGLIWQKCSWGQTNDATCSGSAISTIWLFAINYCNTLTLAGKTWRLPNSNELYSLLHKTSASTIDITYFPNTVNSYYWTSSSYLNYTASAWSLSFWNGSLQAHGKTFNLYTRCVADP